MIGTGAPTGCAASQPRWSSAPAFAVWRCAVRIQVGQTTADDLQATLLSLSLYIRMIVQHHVLQILRSADMQLQGGCRQLCSVLRRRVLLLADLVSFNDVPAAFGNLTALETMSLLGCEVNSLPATITRLTRCSALLCLGNCNVKVSGVQPGLRDKTPCLPTDIK